MQLQQFMKRIHEFFIRRLQIIGLGADTMVMDHDDAVQRVGNEVTYKRKKGFQSVHDTVGRIGRKAQTYAFSQKSLKYYCQVR